MADSVALMRASNNTGKMMSAMKHMWDERSKFRAKADNAGSFDLVIRAQIDEVFLVLAHLGEAILPLGVFNKDYYMQTLGDVQASIASCGNELLPMAWAELDAELQYVCTAGLAFCACFAPTPVYRGFGACVLSDYDWACPDLAYLEEKAKKKAIWTVYGVKQRVDPQPTKSAFIAFDQAIQMLQVKPLAFLQKRPLISSFAEHQPHYGPKPKREVKNNLELLEDWVKALERRGHPAPKGSSLTSWGIPFATWTSQYSCNTMKSVKDCETLAYYQMDPGRLLHAFVCRGNTNLGEGQILLLLPGSPAESLLGWLEGLPGSSHKIVRWQDLDTATFESKISKSLRKKIGHYPLPTQYAIRDPNASRRPNIPVSASSPSVLEHPNTVSPPPYSPLTTERRSDRSQPTAVELGQPDPREMSATPVQPHHSSTTPASGSNSQQLLASSRLAAASGLKSIHTLRRKPSGQPNAAQLNPPSSQVGNARAIEGGTSPATAELPADSAVAEASSSDAPPVAELATDFQLAAPAPLLARKPVQSRENLRAGTTPGLVVTTETTQEPDKMDPVEAPDTSSQPRIMGTGDPALQPNAASTSQTEIRVQKASDVPGETEPPDMPPGPPKSPTDSAVRKDTGSSDHYLDLLNRVAKGEISPQALSEILQKGDLTQPQSEAETKSAAEQQDHLKPLPSPPYPLSKEERALDLQQDGQNNVPACLRPGAHQS